MVDISVFENLLVSGQDNALLRYSLGQAYLKEGESSSAIEHFKKAVEQDPTYSAAWKLYGKALVELDRRQEAISVYEQGIQVAEQKGDKQAAKEMIIFLKRLRKDT
ncbi:MAG TPA: tetratricopeptide repeat protein [Gammaproteobacteria bacterium]|nr:tetratricopeptide repeat protein [Gammaproteobacteria bacterium]